MASTTFRFDDVVRGLARRWRCAPWSRNPLVRIGDRLLTLVRLVAVLATLAAVPLAGAVGSITYADDAAHIRAERAERTTAQVLVLDAPRRDADGGYRAPVRGHPVSATTITTATVSRTTSAGDTVTVWIDATGAQTSAPREPVAAVVNGIGAAVVCFTAVALLCWCAVSLAEWSVGGRRSVGWDREWARFAHPAQGGRP
ncbi:Rv1733c family protein [Nocardia thailandica]